MALISKKHLSMAIQSLQSVFNKKLKDSKADWNQNDSSADDYVKNRTHWEEVVEKQSIFLDECSIGVTYYEENEHSGFDGEYDQELIIGQKYTVTLDGETFVDLICFDDEGYPTLGAPWLDYSEYHFCLYTWMNDDGQIVLSFYTNSISDTHTISVVKKSTEIAVHKLDKKYLPDGISSKPDWEQNDETAADYIKNRPFYEEETRTYLQEQTIVTLDSNGYGSYELDNYLECTKTYTIVWDGIVYETTIGNNNDGDDCADLEINGERLRIVNSDSFQGTASMEGEHTLEIYTKETTIKQLDEKYIPDSVKSGASNSVPVVVFTQQNLIIDGETCPTEFAVDSEDTIYLQNSEWFNRVCDALNSNAHVIFKDVTGLIIQMGVSINMNPSNVSFKFETNYFMISA